MEHKYGYEEKKFFYFQFYSKVKHSHSAILLGDKRANDIQF